MPVAFPGTDGEREQRVPPKPLKLRKKRSETDTSLQAERSKTDDEIAKRKVAVEDVADEVVEKAREQADALVGEARQKADGAGVPAAEVASERASEDEAVLEDREADDEKLEQAREELKQAPARLMEEERSQTDDRLGSERALADRSVDLRDEFLAMVSHDVRGIIAGMALSADFMLSLPQKGAVGKRTHTEAQRIGRLTARMNRLVNDLLDVVSMESGKLSVDRRQQDAAGCLREVLESFQRAAATRKVQLSSQHVSGAIMANFDRDRVVQVLSNLVGNALKFTDSGGSIVLRLARRTTEIEFAVEDGGCGIAPAQLATIFERFSQAQVDRRGLGLGLYIAKCIVDAHGGTIWVRSELGKGTAFHFTLPTRQGSPSISWKERRSERSSSRDATSTPASDAPVAANDT